MYTNITLNSFASSASPHVPLRPLPTSHCSTHKCTSSLVGQHVTANWSFIHFNSSYSCTILHVFFIALCSTVFRFPLLWLTRHTVLHSSLSYISTHPAKASQESVVVISSLSRPIPPCESIIRTSHSFIARSSSSISCRVCDRSSALIHQPITVMPQRPSPLDPFPISPYIKHLLFFPVQLTPGEHKPFQAAYHVRSCP